MYIAMRIATALVTLIALSGSVSAAEPEIIRAGKQATALVQVGDAGSGTAFCIDPAGLFITNRHVTAALPAGQRLKVIVNPSLENQQILDAQVVTTSARFDLALLYARDAKGLTALTLGDDKSLIETQSIMAFGYPFGQLLAVNPKDYPGVSVNTGRITSLRRESGRLAKIQIDAAVNPGNSGGPLLDSNGNVVGVIVSGVRVLLGQTGVNFAIPVSQVQEFLALPHPLLITPNIAYADRFNPVDFTCNLLRAGGIPAGISVELLLDSPAGETRRFEMTRRAGGLFHVKVAPLIQPPGGRGALRATAFGEKGLVRGWIQDGSIRLGSQSVDLSRVKSIDRFPLPHVTLIGGGTISGDLSESGQFVAPTDDGEGTLSLPMAKLTRCSIDATGADEAVGYHLIVRSAGKTIARSDRTIAFLVEGKDQSAAEPISSEVEPAVPATERTESLKLPGIDGARLAGSGRLLVVHLGPDRMFAVIELSSVRIIAYVPVDSEKVVFAAGANDLVVYVPGAGELRRYDLRSGTLLLTSSVEFGEPIDHMEMGASSTGPLLVRTADNRKSFFDVPTLRHMTTNWGQIEVIFEQYRASADGSTFTGWFGGGAYRVHTWDNNATGRYVHSDYGDVYPNFDGSMAFGIGALADRDLSLLISEKPDRRPVPDHRFLPTWSAGLFARLNFGYQEDEQIAAGELFGVAEHKKLCDLPSFPEMMAEPRPQRSFLWIDERLMFFPADNLIVEVPFVNDRVIIRRFDFADAISRANPANPLYVTSVPPGRFVEGQAYMYAVKTVGGKLPLRYHLDAAPVGMTISQEGLVLWNAPPTVFSDELPVSLSITDASGARRVHSFDLQPERNPPGLCPRLRVDGSVIPIAVRARFDDLVKASKVTTASSELFAKLVKMCLAEIDAPELAAPYGPQAGEKLARLATVAAKPVSQVTERDADELGKWYFDAAGRMEGEAKSICQRNASLYFTQWLSLHASADDSRTQIERQLGQIAEPFGVDLLKLVQRDLFVQGGSWKLSDGALECVEVGQHARMQFPCLPGDSYRLHVEFTSAARAETDVMFPVGLGDANLALGAWKSQAGFQNLPGRQRTPTELQPFAAESGHRYSLDVLVALHGTDARIAVDLDGARLIAWQGKQTDIHCPPVWGLPMKKAIGLGGREGVRFYSVKLYPLSRDAFVRFRPTVDAWAPVQARTFLAELASESKRATSMTIAPDSRLPVNIAAGGTASWDIGKRYSRLVGTVSANSDNALAKVVCDGREIWIASLRKGVTNLAFSLDVHGVHKLELSSSGGTGVSWLSTRLLTADEAPPIEANAPVWKKVVEAAGQHMLIASPVVGGGGGEKFEEIAPGGGILVGLRISMDMDQRDWRVQSVQGVYLKPDRSRVLGKRYGDLGRAVAQIDAPPGYVIGAIRAAGQGNLDGLEAVCVRLREDGLNAEDVDDRTVWWGRGKSRGEKSELGSRGKPIIGLTGSVNGGLQSLGVYAMP
jgi:hypothetical protein